MTEAGLFAIGAGVTLLVFAGLALLIYAAILDGRDERAARAFASVTALDSRRSTAA